MALLVEFFQLQVIISAFFLKFYCFFLSVMVIAMDELQGVLLIGFRQSAHLCALKCAMKATQFWCPNMAFLVF